MINIFINNRILYEVFGEIRAWSNRPKNKTNIIAIICDEDFKFFKYNAQTSNDEINKLIE